MKQYGYFWFLFLLVYFLKLNEFQSPFLMTQIIHISSTWKICSLSSRDFKDSHQLSHQAWSSGAHDQCLVQYRGSSSEVLFRGSSSFGAERGKLETQVTFQLHTQYKMVRQGQSNYDRHLCSKTVCMEHRAHLAPRSWFQIPPSRRGNQRSLEKWLILH